MMPWVGAAISVAAFLTSIHQYRRIKRHRAEHEARMLEIEGR